MKKILISMMALMVAASSFAQNPKIGKEIKATKNFADGMALLEAQFANLTDEDKGKAYDELYKLAKEEADPSLTAVSEGKAEGVNYKPIMNAINMAAECEKYGSKNAQKNAEEIYPYRPVLINAANTTNDDKEKLEYSVCYTNTAKEGDANAALAYYFAGYAFYQTKDYANAVKYSKQALSDDRVKEMAEQVCKVSLEQNTKTREDSLVLVKELKALNLDKYFNQICVIYQDLGMDAEVTTLVEETIQKNPQNKIAYFTRGSLLNSKKQYDAAKADFKKATEIDPSFVHAWFNMGVATSQKGFDLNEKYTDKTGKIPTDKAAEVTACLKEAITYYEKVKELDPSYQTITNWPMQLRMLYNAVGDKAKADEISKLLGDM